MNTIINISWMGYILGLQNNKMTVPFIADDISIKSVARVAKVDSLEDIIVTRVNAQITDETDFISGCDIQGGVELTKASLNFDWLFSLETEDAIELKARLKEKAIEYGDSFTYDETDRVTFKNVLIAPLESEVNFSGAVEFVNNQLEVKVNLITFTKADGTVVTLNEALPDAERDT